MARLKSLILLFLISSQSCVVDAYLYEALGCLGGVVFIALLGQRSLNFIGFTAVGITAGSFAAWLMSWGLPVATLQSAGAAGVSYGAYGVWGLLGSIVAHYLGWEDKKD
ncbi:interferon alpha-inducible protein 27-like protein 2A [Biomphalaria pfeifferi]|uniref:Interferon alpha-inducible protein 27-like protein 2A n=1 Tax=Biomphalaria pfeifferi TaxID=112525 RepID=A0AAD8EZQ2_BIOPF|nr:interferon alpha-inducible protein 27-like protein 2A [Biomphalaria pfeifferi]